MQNYAHIGLVFAALLLVVATGCQSSVRMTRPDADATLSRPDNWLRERNREAAGTLFQIRHPVEPVRVRLRRLDAALIPEAHQSWAKIWIDAALQDADILEIEASTLDGSDAVEVRSQFADDAETLTHELWLTNAGGATYLLEAWGTPKAMERTGEARRRIVQSLGLPSRDGDATSGDIAATEVDDEHWTASLPAVRDARVAGEWSVERSNDAKTSFALPSHLIEGEVLSEELDYPIGAAQYAQVALGMKIEARRDRYAVTIRVEGDPNVRVPMHTTYRFLTRGERAVQIAVSTPHAVYEKNREVIDALVESLRIKTTAAAAEQRDNTSEK